MNLAGFNTLDTLSTIGVCTYPVEALTGTPDISEDIREVLRTSPWHGMFD